MSGGAEAEPGGRGPYAARDGSGAPAARNARTSEWMGLRMLRALWINLDLIWSAALMLTVVLTPLA